VLRSAPPGLTHVASRASTNVRMADIAEVEEGAREHNPLRFPASDSLPERTVDVRRVWVMLSKKGA